MKAELERRWAEEIDKRMGQLKTPLDVMRRHVSGEDYIDSAILAGVSISDILAGQVAESHVPPQVIEAFHDQYPQYGASFVEAIHRMSGDPDRIMGLVSGIKGKLFEIDYVEWLNHGLPGSPRSWPSTPIIRDGMSLSTIAMGISTNFCS